MKCPHLTKMCLLSKSMGRRYRRHFGSRITFDDSHLYFSIGDRGDRDNSQDTMTHFGSILRLNTDGSTPSDSIHR
ncbi:PQQ-dependent sugar dehydrogenase [Vibrio lentus]|nr:PQQ-dependent sugar dehydrogenase [Vibrio lentus]